jgi:hypothetical protein
MKKDQKAKKQKGEYIYIMPEFKYKPKRPKTTATAILSNQLRALPLEQRASFLNELGRSAISANRDLNKKK